MFLVTALEEEIEEVAAEQAAADRGQHEPVLQKCKKVEQEGDFFAAVTVAKDEWTQQRNS
jgi:hypothetical protein